MAQNSRPRSASSASNKKKYDHERAHARSTRRVDTATPKVIATDFEPRTPSGVSRTPTSARNSTRSSARSGSRAAGSSSARHASGRSTTAGRATSNNSPQRSSSRRSNQGSRANAQNRATARQSQATKKQRAPRRKGGIGFKIGVAVGLVVLLIGGFIALYFSPLFPITSVEVVGNEKLERDYVIALAEVPDDSTFLRTDTASIEAHLLAEPWIQSASIERNFPGTLVLHIVEQPVAAVVDIVPETAAAATERWVIAEDGTWITKVATAAESGAEAEGAAGSEGEAAGEGTQGAEGTEGADGAEGSTPEGTDGTEADITTGEGVDGAGDADGATDSGAQEGSGGPSTVLSAGIQIKPEELVEIPKIKDVSAAVRPVSGEVETDEGITNALALLKGFSSDMRAMVASISAPDAIKTTLTLYNNVGVAFGAAEDIEAKEQAIATLLAEHEGKITYINVRVADRASYRATE